MYVQPNTIARSRNNCCGGKALSFTYSECVSVALVTQHAMRMRHTAICGLSTLLYFPTLSHKRYDFGGRKKRVTEQKNVCFDFLYNFCLKHFSF